MKNEKEELRKFMSEIKPCPDLTLNEIPKTIEKAFLAGMNRVDDKYRKAIFKACEEMGIDTNLFFRTVLKHLD